MAGVAFYVFGFIMIGFEVSKEAAQEWLRVHDEMLVDDTQKPASVPNMAERVFAFDVRGNGVLLDFGISAATMEIVARAALNGMPLSENYWRETVPNWRKLQDKFEQRGMIAKRGRDARQGYTVTAFGRHVFRQSIPHHELP